MTKKDIWRLWSAHEKCALRDALILGRAAVFPGEISCSGRSPKAWGRLWQAAWESGYFVPKDIVCDSVDTVGVYNMWQAGHGWEAGTYFAQLDCAIFVPKSEISKPTLLVLIVPEGADVPWLKPLGMCWVKGSTLLWHLAEAKLVEIGRQTNWHISDAKGWIRDPCSDYCML